MANFKKVLAAVLSAAMVLTLAPVGATSVQAATKATAGTSTLKVSASKATLKVGAKKTIKITVNKAQAANLKVSLKSSKAAVAKVAAKTTIKKGAKTATFKIVAKKAGKANITVSYKTSANKTVKKTIKVTVKAVETNDDNVDVTDGKIKLVDASGLQTNGTAWINDTLRVEIPASLGTMTQIIWYRDGNQIATSNSTGDASDTAGAGIDTGIPGKYYAVAITAKGTTYKSNEITITDEEAAAVLKGFAIEDDYTDGTDITYATTDTTAVITITVNKAYPGRFQVWKKTDSKYTAEQFRVNAATGAIDTTKDTNFTVVNAAAGTGYGYRAPNGEVTYKYRVPAAGVVRGTEYVVTFDQTNIGTDTPGAGTANVFETAATAPYVKAPASIAVTKVSNGNVPEVTFYDEDKAVMGWFGVTGNTPANVGLAASEVYSATSKTNDTKASGVTALNNTTASGTVVKGVWTTAVPAGNVAYWFATVKTTAGIFAKDAAELKSEPVMIAQAAATQMKLVQKSDAATTATVSFSNLRTAGTVYIVQGGDDSATAGLGIGAAITAFEKDTPTTYVQKATVAAGTLTVDIANAIHKVSTSAGNNEYAAIFIPDDETNFGRVQSVTNATSTNSDANTANDFPMLTVNQKLAKFAFADGFTAGTTVVTGATYAASSVLKAQDQFGEAVFNLAGATNAPVNKVYKGTGADSSMNEDVYIEIQTTDAGAVTLIAAHGAITGTPGASISNMTGTNVKYDFKLSTGQTLSVSIGTTANEATLKLA